MKQEESIKSLEILLDENLTWKGHLKTLKIILLNLKRHYKRRAITYFNFDFKSLSGQVVPIDYYKDFCFF